jgi:hypothetical protein
VSAYKTDETEHFYIYSMGKRLRVIAYALSVADANFYMEKHDEAAVVACFGELVLMADKHDKGAA